MDVLLVAGIIIVIGLIGGKLSGRLKFPGVIGYIIAGIIIGPSALGVFNYGFLERAGVINDFALGIIAFLIKGGSFIEINVRRFRCLHRGFIIC